jgi:hypothetical protein
MPHNYSYKKENFLYRNQWRERGGRNAKQGQKQGVLFIACSSAQTNTAMTSQQNTALMILYTKQQKSVMCVPT